MFSMEAAMAVTNDTTQTNTNKKLPTWIGGKKGSDPQNKPGGYGYQPKKKQDGEEPAWSLAAKGNMGGYTPGTRYNPKGTHTVGNTTVSNGSNVPGLRVQGTVGPFATTKKPTGAMIMPGGLSPQQRQEIAMGGPQGNATPGSGDLAFGPDGQTFTIGEDAITQNPDAPYSSYKGYKMPHKFEQPTGAPGRTMTGDGVAPGTLDPSMWDMTAPTTTGGGFGTRYGWGGGGGGWGGGGYSKKPAWLNQMMRLYSWNIK